MPKKPPVMIMKIEPEEVAAYVDAEGDRIMSNRLQKVYNEPAFQLGGGPLSVIEEVNNRSSMRPFMNDTMDMDEVLHTDHARGFVMTPVPLSTAPPSNFGQRYRHAEFENEWYQLRRPPTPEIPDPEGFRARGFSPVPPPPTPASMFQGPLYREPGFDPYHLEQYLEQETEEFNFWPYLIFGAILIGLAVITDDPRGETTIAYDT